MNYFGLLLSLHIRLSNENNIRYLPILVIDDFDIVYMNNNDVNGYALLFFTPNIFYSLPNDISQNISKIQDESESLKDNFKEKFIDKINIKHPSEYAGHHDITNEWSIHAWSDCLTTDPISENDKIKSKLYFKYLMNKYDAQLSSQKLVLNTVSKSAKVLYIDDQYKKGWDVVFKKVFSSFPNVDFEIFENDYSEQDEIVRLTKDLIKNEPPDVIILDLRLHIDDHNLNYDDNYITNLTGVKILEEIQNINKGIQVIVFTATSKSLILDYLNKKGILGYIKKESPESNFISVKENIEKLYDLLNDGIENSYLIEVYSLYKSMTNILGNSKPGIDDSQRRYLELNLDIIFNILSSNNSNKLNYAMLSIYKCLEIIKDSYSCLDGSKIYIASRKNKASTTHSTINYAPRSNKRGYSFYVSTGNRVNIIMKEKLSVPNNGVVYQHLTDISRRRNKYIHPNENFVDVNSTEIKEWIDMLHIIISHLN